MGGTHEAALCLRKQWIKCDPLRADAVEKVRGMPAERNNRINGASFCIELAHMALVKIRAESGRLEADNASRASRFARDDR